VCSAVDGLVFVLVQLLPSTQIQHTVITVISRQVAAMTTKNQNVDFDAPAST